MKYLKKLFLLLPVLVLFLVSCEEKEIKPHSHNFSNEWTVDIEPSCTEAGSKSHHCLDCDEKTDVTPIEMLEHSYGEWQVTKEPTKEETGLKERECNLCHHKETEDIPVIVPEHNYSTEWTIDKEPTCTEAGSKSHHCLDCDEKTDVTPIEKLAHTFGEWQVTKEATKEEKGLKEKECSVCHHKETVVIETLEFELNADETGYIVTGVGNVTSLEIVIPAIYKNLPVTAIGAFAFNNCSSLTNIAIPDSVTNVGDYAFSGCDSLQYNGYDNGLYLGNSDNLYLCLIKAKNKEITSCIINENTKVIYQSAFDECKNLTNIAIPDSVTNVGDYAFSGCDSLQYNEYDNGLYLGNSNNPYICLIKAKNKEIISCVINENTKFIHSYAFDTCSCITGIVIPNSVTSIEYGAFFYCVNLISVTIGNHVASIGDGAFSGCGSLTNVYYEGTIENWCNITFNDNTFESDTSSPMYYASHFYLKNSNNEWGEITSIEIPNTVTSIGNYQFYGFKNVTSITIPDSVTSIGRDAFVFCSKLTDVYYEGAIEDWCKIELVYAYANPMCYAGHFHLRNSSNEWEEITNIEIPNTITSIGDYQFESFNNVTSITIPNSVESIGFASFSECSSLTSIEIPDSVTSIGIDAFFGCSSLTSIVIPASVESIDWYAFSECSNLTLYCEATSEPSGWNSGWNYGSELYWYSVDTPSSSGNYWHYVDDVVTIWE